MALMAKPVSKRCEAHSGTYHCARPYGHGGEHKVITRVSPTGHSVYVLNWGGARGEVWSVQRVLR